MTILKTATVAGIALLTIAGCGRDDDDMMVATPVVQTETPIYAKDGTVIGMRPTVGMDPMMSDDDDIYED